MQVSAAFRRLALSKHVWLAVLYNLGNNNLLDLPPRHNLLSFSTTQLIEQVKRAVFGPETWAANSSRAPTVRRQTHVALWSTVSSPPTEPALLSGDKHLLLKRGDGCEIWDINEDKQIWARLDVHRRHIVAQPVNDDTEILIALWTGQPVGLLPDPTRLDYRLVAELHLLGLKANTVREISTIQFPRTLAKLSDPLIAGDFWAADVQWFAQGAWDTGILIVNWREKLFVLLAYNVVHKKILRGYLLALTNVGEMSRVVLYPWAAFDSHWRPFTSAALVKASYCPFRMVPITLQEVEYPALPGWRTPLMTVHDCLLQRGSYIISTYTASINGLPSDEETYHQPSLHRYRLTLPTAISGPPIWKRVSSAGILNCVFVDSLTYAGYGLSFSSSSRRPALSAVCRPAMGEETVDGTWTVPLQAQNPDSVYMSSTTSALAVCSARGADILYY
ncbi:hypothetical protein B0H19DRAFT_1130293, partial [Mycena capillaripes]